MGKFDCTVWGFAKKGSKLLRHYDSKLNLPLPTGEVDFVVEFTKPTKSGEGTIFKMLNRAKKKCAFTLSEVLIVLAVLGVVAAITIPDLIQDYREKALITALKKSYTVFSQAVDMATAENGAPNTWDIGTASSQEGALKLYNILKPYLRIEKTCGPSSGCFADHYEALFNTSATFQPNASRSHAKGVLASGTSFYVLSEGTGCLISKGICADIGVDVNGKKGPNKAGLDLFAFYISTDGLRPAGSIKVVTTLRCLYGNTSTYNGRGCTYWALKHGNMDYLRKAGNYYGY